MFICNKCGEKCLTDEGRVWGLMGLSFGPCEMCGKTRDCYDVSSSFDWAFKQSKPQTKRTKNGPSHRKQIRAR